VRHLDDLAVEVRHGLQHRRNAHAPLAAGTAQRDRVPGAQVRAGRVARADDHAAVVQRPDGVGAVRALDRAVIDRAPRSGIDALDGPGRLRRRVSSGSSAPSTFGPPRPRGPDVAVSSPPSRWSSVL
jgi:hypothetical protein